MKGPENGTRPGTGTMAAYASAGALLEALRRLRGRGYTRLEAYTPYEVEELDEVLELPRSRLPAAALVAGLLGAAGAYLLQWWISAVDYPILVGGRPLHSAPAFVLITFETGILFAALTLFVGYFWRAGLPRLWDPVFEVPGFERASVDRYWLAVSSEDPRYDPEETVALLEETSPLELVRIPARPAPGVSVPLPEEADGGAGSEGEGGAGRGSGGGPLPSPGEADAGRDDDIGDGVPDHRELP